VVPEEPLCTTDIVQVSQIFNYLVTFEGPATLSKSLCGFAVKFLKTAGIESDLRTPRTELDQKVADCVSLDLISKGKLLLVRGLAILCYQHAPVETRPLGDAFPLCACGLHTPSYTRTDQNKAFYEYPRGHKAEGMGREISVDLHPDWPYAVVDSNQGFRVIRKNVGC